MLFIDLDHFKIINDSLGHAAGDDLLVTVAQRLRHTLRPGDLLARFGGDEFVLLCTNVLGDRARVATIAQRLIAAVAEPILVGDDEVFVTASVGIAVANEGRHRRDAAAARRRRDVPGEARRTGPGRRCSAPTITARPSPRSRPATTSTARSTATSSCCTTSRSSTCAPDA